MSSLSPPWTGLSLLAPRVELGGVVAALRELSPAERADPARLVAAGLNLAEAARVAAEGPWGSPRAAVRFRCALDPGWPEELIGPAFAPVALALEGDVGLLARPKVAVVGARACTAYGRDVARRLAAALAGAGVVVVSGLAAGIDVAAHGAAGGRTIAVLGQGLDAPMPDWQRRARRALLDAGGLVVAELPPDAHADTFTFPVRNRIIAGLAEAVVVVEAAERSGARNTAAHARRYGREVLAVPGPLGAPASVGCLELLERGARLVRGPETILGLPRLRERVASAPAEPEEPLLAGLAAPTSAEALASATGLSYREVSARLGLLELTGRVTRLPGGRYQVRTR